MATTRDRVPRPCRPGVGAPAGPSGPPPSLGELRARRGEFLAHLARYGVRELRVFGSVARGQQGPGSDLDLLVDLAPPPRQGLFDLAGIGAALEDLLGSRWTWSPRAFCASRRPRRSFARP